MSLWNPYWTLGEYSEIDDIESKIAVASLVFMTFLLIAGIATLIRGKVPCCSCCKHVSLQRYSYQYVHQL